LARSAHRNTWGKSDWLTGLSFPCDRNRRSDIAMPQRPAHCRSLPR
jgi:hypothetical protein